MEANNPNSDGEASEPTVVDELHLPNSHAYASKYHTFRTGIFGTLFDELGSMLDEQFVRCSFDSLRTVVPVLLQKR
jgi:hypothetical protein